MKIYPIAILTILLIVGCTTTNQFQDQLDKAIVLMEGDSLVTPDTVQAITHFQSAAENGNAEAQYYLGYYYHHGIGVERNETSSLSWYEKSANAGFSPAQNKMGMIYYSGTEKDYSQAKKWFTLSAKQDYSQAQYMLGKIYSTGKGVEPDTTKAIKWLKKSVSSGHPYPEFLLGKLLYESAKTPKDLEEAHHWVKVSADKGVGHAKELLQEMDNKKSK